MTGRHTEPGRGGEILALVVLVFALAGLTTIGVLVVWVVARGLVSPWLLLTLPALAVVAVEQLYGARHLLEDGRP